MQANPRLALLAATAAVLATMPAYGATLYWDGTNTSANADGGVGTWDNGTTSNWDTLPFGGANSVWTNGSHTAVFGPTAATVLLGDNITLGGIRFTDTAYTIDGLTNSKTLTLGAGNNLIEFSRLTSAAGTATITGAIAGSGNLILSQRDYPQSGTLTLNNTGTGWSGSTTVNAATNLTLGQTSQALATSSAININGGTILIQRANDAIAGNQIADGAAITFNGGGLLRFQQMTAIPNKIENIGAVTINSGQVGFDLQNGTSNGGNFVVLNSLTRTVNSAAATFGYNANMLFRNAAVATDTAPGGIIGPWATIGNAGAMTDYAIYTGGNGTLAPANIAATAENSGSWVAGSNVTLSGATTLTGTRTLNSLRYTGGTGALALGASNFNLETYGILGGGTSGNTFTISNAGSGALTTPTGGGLLFLTAGNNNITVSSKISNNGGAVSPVITAQGRTVTLSGTNDFTGSVILNSGTLVTSADANLGATGVGASPLIVNGYATYQAGNTTYARGITLNNGAILQFDNNNPTFSGNVTGTGGIRIGVSSFGNQVTLSGTGNTFEGPILISGTGTTGQAYRVSVASLTDSSTANGSIVFRTNAVSHGNGSVFEYSGTGNLVLDNRVVEIANTGISPTNGHQIRRTGNGTLTINTDLLVNSQHAQVLSLAGGNTTGVNTFGGIISDNPNAAIGNTRLYTGFSSGVSTITLSSVQGISVGASISGTGIAGGTTVTAVDRITNQVNLSNATNASGSVQNVITVDGVRNPTSIRKVDAGTWVLGNANTYSGSTQVLGGILQLSNSLALQNSAIDATSSVTGDAGNGLKTTVTSLSLGGINGTKNLSSLFTTTSGGYGGVTALTLNPGAGVTHSYSGAIADGATGMALTKTGAGTQILNGVNGFTGDTVIKAGTLALGAAGTFDNSLAIVVGDTGSTGAVLDLTAKPSFAFGSGQTVSGIGTINIGSGKTVTVNGAIAPGNSVGTLSLTGNFASSATTDLSAEVINNTKDLLAITGNVDLTATGDELVVAFSGAQTLTRYVLATYTGSLTGQFDQLTVTGWAGPGTWEQDYSQLGEIAIVVPEPTTLGLLAMGAIGLMRRRRA